MLGKTFIDKFILGVLLLAVLVIPAHAADPLPASVQLVGPRWSEPRLIALAACLENVLQG